MTAFTSLVQLIATQNLQGRVVLVRLDLNVPLHEDGRVRDATRLERSLPTLRALVAARAKIVLLSHFGRPKNGPDTANSLRPIAAALGQMLDTPVAFAADCVGPVAQAAVAALAPGQCLLLENTRFHAGEEANDPALVAQLASLGEIFVNDAFSAAHRAHASTTGLATRLPAYAGHALTAELTALAHALEAPKRPVLAVVGGSKISTKLALLENLIAKVDRLVLGGGMANTLLAAQGVAMGASLVESSMLETARQLQAAAQAKGCQIILPTDVVVAEKLAAHVPTTIKAVGSLSATDMALDVGPASVAALVASLPEIATLVWNGPLGAFEFPPFDAGTNALAQAVAARTQAGQLLSVAGGGDTVAALEASGAATGFSYLSTAGGAFLEYLEGKTLPGVAALAATARAA